MDEFTELAIEAISMLQLDQAMMQVRLLIILKIIETHSARTDRQGPHIQGLLGKRRAF
jgi:hypothetical protein